jgi:hypothetical protein
MSRGTAAVGFRSVEASGPELDRVLDLTSAEPLWRLSADRYRAEAAERQYRPEWTWIAEDADGRILARALWWGQHDSAYPLVLDCLLTAAVDAHSKLVGVMALDIADGQIQTIHSIVNPDKLEHIDQVSDLGALLRRSRRPGT